MENKNSFINLGSLTFAQKAQKLLENNSVESSVGKMPSGNSGCSFGIFIKDRKREEVIALVRSFGIKVL